MLKRKEKRIFCQEPTKICFWSGVGVLILCLFSYGYFVRQTIVNIVARQNMESEITELSAKILTRETAYLKAKNEITEELAENKGFIAVSRQKFVVQSVKTPGLSLVLPNR